MHSRSTQITVEGDDFYCRLEVRTNATAIVSPVKRILFLLFWERRRNRQRPLCDSYLRVPRPDDRQSIPVTGSEGGGTVSAVDYE